MTETSETSNINKAKSHGAKEKIITAAIREFSRNGLAGARVDQIAREAGVNKAMIYYHFSSKENLYHEIIRELLSSRLSVLQRNMESGHTLETILRGAVDLHADLFLGQSELVNIILRELADPKSQIIEIITGIIQQSGLPAQLSKMLTDGVNRGEYRPMNVRQTILSFITMSIGYYLMSPVFDKIWQVGHRPTFVEERKAAIVDLFMNGVKAR